MVHCQHTDLLLNSIIASQFCTMDSVDTDRGEALCVHSTGEVLTEVGTRVLLTLLLSPFPEMIMAPTDLFQPF